MIETYTKIIPNVKDDKNNIVTIKIVFQKIIEENQSNIVRAEAFDSKGRYFYQQDEFEKDFEYYINKEWELTDIKYIYFEGILSIVFLDGGSWNEFFLLDEIIK